MLQRNKIDHLDVIEALKIAKDKDMAEITEIITRRDEIISAMRNQLNKAQQDNILLTNEFADLHNQIDFRMQQEMNALKKEAYQDRYEVRQARYEARIARDEIDIARDERDTVRDERDKARNERDELEEGVSIFFADKKFDMQNKAEKILEVSNDGIYLLHNYKVFVEMKNLVKYTLGIESSLVSNEFEQNTIPKIAAVSHAVFSSAKITANFIQNGRIAMSAVTILNTGLFAAKENTDYLGYSGIPGCIAIEGLSSGVSTLLITSNFQLTAINMVFAAGKCVAKGYDATTILSILEPADLLINFANAPDGLKQYVEAIKGVLWLSNNAKSIGGYIATGYSAYEYFAGQPESVSESINKANETLANAIKGVLWLSNNAKSIGGYIAQTGYSAYEYFAGQPESVSESINKANETLANATQHGNTTSAVYEYEDEDKDNAFYLPYLQSEETTYFKSFEETTYFKSFEEKTEL